MLQIHVYPKMLKFWTTGPIAQHLTTLVVFPNSGKSEARSRVFRLSIPISPNSGRLGGVSLSSVSWLHSPMREKLEARSPLAFY
ncbi:hypothetical protein [Trichocoleus desertorum]|uniref:hypothetical protein n=1 Tax=Trichocoleus desertorum TaxID=1481672 RepID=UPI00329A1614